MPESLVYPHSSDIRRYRWWILYYSTYRDGLCDIHRIVINSLLNQ